MLVLTRRIGEEVIIAGNIQVRIVAIQGGKVRLGIQAPDAICVDRRETHERRKSFAGDCGTVGDGTPSPDWFADPITRPELERPATCAARYPKAIRPASGRPEREYAAEGS